MIIDHSLNSALELARARLLRVTGRLMLVTWIPLFVYSAYSVWDRPVVRSVVLLNLGMNLLAAVVVLRPSQRYAWLQALVFLSLLTVGIPAAGGVSGITPAGMATAVVLVAWATLFFGARGLWAMLAMLAVVLSYTAWEYINGRVLASRPPDLTDAGYWARNVLFLVSTFVLGGLIVRSAISAYDDTLAAEVLARSALAHEEAARQIAESEAVVLQRREAAAALVAGLAHDIANVFQVTSLHAESVLETASGDQSRHAAQQILNAAQRGNAMVRELLAIGRSSPDNADSFDGDAAMRTIESTLRGILPPSVRANFRRDTSLWLTGDALRFEQVVINLVLNARDAMPAGGALDVSLTRAEDNEATPSATLSVADTGCGIAPDLQTRIFDPFFTTKGSRDGSGLGLSMVSRIVGEAGGRIELTSEVGRGSTFNVTWPIGSPSTAAHSSNSFPNHLSRT